MNENMNIPKTINVGFVERGDTFTGQLSYVIYTDEKGVLRKEKSWNSWRNHKIDALEFDNVPTEGIVLNKKAGGDKWGWNQRQTYCRVYDPRGFEFEIGIENLLYILEECSSIKGKGIEGEFVYAWSGTELILLPVTSQEYISSMKFTEAKLKKVTKNEMLPGCLYTNKDMEDVVYLGRYEYYDKIEIGYKRSQDTKKRHIFKYVDTKNQYCTYWVQTGFTKLAERITEEPIDGFSDMLEEFLKGEHHAELVEVVVEPVSSPLKWTNHYRTDSKTKYINTVAEQDGKIYLVCVHNHYTPEYSYGKRSDPDFTKATVKFQNEILMKPKGLPHYGDYVSYKSYRGYVKPKIMSIEDLPSFCKQIVAVLASGERIILK